MYLNSIFYKNSIHKLILEQIEQAFENKSNIAGTIHGQRKIYQGCYGRRTALFPSTKCNGSIPVESRLELAHAVSLEQDPQVKHYRTQALKIPLSQNHFSYPDFLIETLDNHYEIHEVKPSISSLSDEDAERFKRLSSLLEPIGITFKLIDNTSIPPEMQLQNLLYWYQRGHRYSWSHFEINSALEHLQAQRFNNLNQIHEKLQVIGLKEELGDYLLFHSKISLPLNSLASTIGGF